MPSGTMCKPIIISYPNLPRIALSRGESSDTINIIKGNWTNSMSLAEQCSPRVRSYSMTPIYTPYGQKFRSQNKGVVNKNQRKRRRATSCGTHSPSSKSVRPWLCRLLRELLGMTLWRAWLTVVSGIFGLDQVGSCRRRRLEKITNVFLFPPLIFSRRLHISYRTSPKWKKKRHIKSTGKYRTCERSCPWRWAFPWPLSPRTDPCRPTSRSGPCSCGLRMWTALESGTSKRRFEPCGNNTVRSKPAQGKSNYNQNMVKEEKLLTLQELVARFWGEITWN